MEKLKTVEEEATNDFFVALYSAREDDALRALVRGASPFKRGSRGGEESPLVASLSRGMEGVALVLAKRASRGDLLWEDPYGWSPLTSAARAGSLDVLRIVAAVDDPAQCRHPGGVTALMCAAESGSLPCLEFLLPASDVEARDAFGLGALEFAAKGRSMAMLERLLGLGLSPDSRMGPTPLMVAAERGILELVERLLDVCDPLAEHPRDGQTALGIALAQIEMSPAVADAIAAQCGVEAMGRALRVAAEAGVDLPRCGRALAEREALDIAGEVRIAEKSMPFKTL